MIALKKILKLNIINNKLEVENMKNKCDKCNSTKLFVEIQGTRRGLYCGECGKWLKWITKQELQVAKFNGVKIIGG
jgi:hypothetical protein